MKLAVVMDPIEKIVPEKDGTLDLLLAAQDRNYELTYFQQEDLKIIDGRPLAKGKVLSVKDTLIGGSNFQIRMNIHYLILM